MSISELSITVLVLLNSGVFVLCDNSGNGEDKKKTKIEAVCQDQEFSCADGSKCISRFQQCDGLPDCDDKSDEDTNCLFFTCGDGSNIQMMFVCDGYPDCEDESDESESKANCTNFECANGKTISTKLLCNDVDDCNDKFISDECDCDGTFKCSNSRCIASYLECDGIDDCGDKSDELLCDVFTCKNGRTIDASLVCDGENDCEDTSDECECQHSFKCENGKCISASLAGNGADDCGDNSDEAFDVTTAAETTTGNITVTTTEGKMESESTTSPIEAASGDTSAIEGVTTQSEKFICDGGKTIDAFFVCNGADDCMDGYRSDECDCSSSFICDNLKCIDDNLTCDGVDDCGDCTDEEECVIPGSSSKTFDMFHCYKGSCIRDTRLCDGHQDCPNGDDEFDCDEEIDYNTTTSSTMKSTTVTTESNADITVDIEDKEVNQVTSKDKNEEIDSGSDKSQGVENSESKEGEGVKEESEIPSRFSSTKPKLEVTTAAKDDSQGGDGNNAKSITSYTTLLSILACVYMAQKFIV